MSENTVPGKRQRNPSSKLASADNVGEFELGSHRDARQRAAQTSTVNNIPITAASTSSHPISTRLGSVTLEEEEDPEASGFSDSTQRPPKKKKRTTRESSVQSSMRFNDVLTVC
jgi:hypothetical protein